jgi:hypothetical protein
MSSSHLFHGPLVDNALDLLERKMLKLLAPLSEILHRITGYRQQDDFLRPLDEEN